MALASSRLMMMPIPCEPRRSQRVHARNAFGHAGVAPHKSALSSTRNPASTSRSPRKFTHTDLLVRRLILALRLPRQNLVTDGEQKEPWQACPHSWPATGGSFVDGPTVLDVVDVLPGAPNETRPIPVLEY